MMKEILVAVAITIILVITARAEERRVETPPQYRGAWCATKWTDIYRRCRESDRDLEFVIQRLAVGWEDWGCELSAVRKGNGEHRVWMTCRDADRTGEASETQERWRLGTNRTRLQIIRRADRP
jgi:hypothetical protein